MQTVNTGEEKSDNKMNTSEKTKSPSSNRSSKRKIKRFRPSSPPSPLTLPQKIIVFLEDNRISPDDIETLRSLRRINDQSQNARLKKILNVVFLSTGVALLLSVIGVVVFTSLVSDEDISNFDRVSDDVFDDDESGDRVDQPNHLPLQEEPGDENAKLSAKDNLKYVDFQGVNLEMSIPKKSEHNLRAVSSGDERLDDDISNNVNQRNKKDCTLVPIQRGTKLRMLDICSHGKRARHK